VELMVVVIIVAIGLGLVLPYITGSMFGGDRRRVMRDLSGLLAHARNQAQLEGEAWELVLDLDEQLFWVWQAHREPPEGMEGVEFDPDAAPEGAGSPAGGVALREVVFRDGREVRTGRAVVGVNPRGMVEPCLVRLDEDDDVLTLFIRSFDGKLRREEGFADFEPLPL
jgi:hypothetical protein